MLGPRGYLLTSLLTPTLILWAADLGSAEALTPARAGAQALIAVVLALPCVAAAALWARWRRAAGAQTPTATPVTALPTRLMLAGPFVLMVSALLLDLQAMSKAPLAWPTLSFLSLPAGMAAIPLGYGLGRLLARGHGRARGATV